MSFSSGYFQDFLFLFSKLTLMWLGVVFFIFILLGMAEILCLYPNLQRFQSLFLEMLFLLNQGNPLFLGFQLYILMSSHRCHLILISSLLHIRLFPLIYLQGRWFHTLISSQLLIPSSEFFSSGIVFFSYKISSGF